MKILLMLFLSVISLTVYSHPGHGESSVFAHDLEHMLWYAIAFVLLSVMLYRYKKR